MPIWLWMLCKMMLVDLKSGLCKLWEKCWDDDDDDFFKKNPIALLDKKTQLTKTRMFIELNGSCP